jgi:HSP20 family protein
MTALTRFRNNGTGLPGWAEVDSPIENLFDNFLTPTRSANIVENENNYEWSVDMPGVGAENVNVEVNDRKGTVSVSTSYENSSEDVKRRRSYHRAVRIGDGIDTEAIEASYENGVLTVTLPKTEREEVTRQIEVT